MTLEDGRQERHHFAGIHQRHIWSKSADTARRGTMTVTTVICSRLLRPQWMQASSLWQLAVFLVVLLSVVTPFLFLVLRQLQPSAAPFGILLFSLGLANYVKVWSDSGTYAVLSNTLCLAVAARRFGIAIAAWACVAGGAHQCPGQNLIYAGVPMTLAMPGMLQAMACALASPRIGFIIMGLMELRLVLGRSTSIYWRA